MIPLIATVAVRGRSRGFRLWIPLGLVWLLLLPIVLLLLPLVVVACWAGRVNPFRALSTFWRILCGFRGADLEASSESGSALIHIF